jgi:phosphoenolpyruvate-protein kinase (PTS system EI component)
MSASSIPRARYLLRNLNKADTLEIVNKVLAMESNEQVLDYLREL